jgi:hypothetical protein
MNEGLRGAWEMRLDNSVIDNELLGDCRNTFYNFGSVADVEGDRGAIQENFRKSPFFL